MALMGFKKLLAESKYACVIIDSRDESKDIYIPLSEAIKRYNDGRLWKCETNPGCYTLLPPNTQCNGMSSVVAELKMIGHSFGELRTKK